MLKMKNLPLTLQLNKGQRICASVDEVLGDGYLIVAFAGQLVRIKNTTKRVLQKNELLELEVIFLSPLQFRFIETKKNLDRLI